MPSNLSDILAHEALRKRNPIETAQPRVLTKKRQELRVIRSLLAMLAYAHALPSYLDK